MNKSSAILMKSQADQPTLVFIGFLVLGLICYLLPWVINPGVQMTMGAYDLAEWTSLHPVVRGDALTLTLLLRFPPILLTWIAALHFSKGGLLRWFGAIFALLMSIAMLPPLEFFTIYREDPNYYQQFILALISLVGSAIALSGLLGRFAPLITIVLCIVGIAISISGLMQASSLMRELQMPTTFGVGGAGMIIAFGLFGAVHLVQLVKSRRIF